MNKPTISQITINGNVFLKNPDQDHLNHSVYVCPETQQMVKVRWSEFFQQWNIEGVCHKNYMDGWKPYYRATNDLSLPMEFPDQYMDVYMTPCQEKGMCSQIEEALLKVWDLR
jgi:hypothetical protein